MALSEGTKIGPYEVIGLIGQGGMGEVWQARDTKLDRDVALKVLPEAFTSDPDRLARFEREAKILASLNHPNIGSIYGLEEAEGVKAVHGVVQNLFRVGRHLLRSPHHRLLRTNPGVRRVGCGDVRLLNGRAPWRRSRKTRSARQVDSAVGSGLLSVH